jgi:hypothetical protein
MIADAAGSVTRREIVDCGLDSLCFASEGRESFV